MIADIESVLADAVKIESAEERKAFLDQSCADRPELRREVERLVRSHLEAGSFLEASPLLTAMGPPDPSINLVGTVIGQYCVLEQIGEGGMGVVYAAAQEKPLRRTVALKVIKPGMDSRQVLARFDAERQALALMDHPNIAKVLDAGTSESGSPYFVMELVRGEPITEFCDSRRLTIRERLELFSKVCQAVQHAHQKGIIHRDIKPSNVLVTLHDDSAVPKVIDFGIAKAIDQRLPDMITSTGLAQLMGSPLYMSPEQARMNALDVDTRSDVYSLGVLLYELITGATPFDMETLKQVGLDEMRRLIREQDPLRPSQRVSELALEVRSTISLHRGIFGGNLNRSLQGELDWIAMKALEKDRIRRYESPSAIAADIQRYLCDEPVLACPPSTGYRLRKFTRRNKVTVISCTLIFLGLVLGIAGTSWGLLHARQASLRESKRAEGERLAKREAIKEKERAEAATVAEKQARELAEMQSAEANAISDFLIGQIFAAAQPKGEDGGMGHDVKLRDVLKAALPFVEIKFKEQPLVEARVRRALGVAFEHLGESKIAAEQFQRALVLHTSLLGSQHPLTVDDMHNLANSMAMLGQQKEALKLRSEVLEICRATLGTDDPRTINAMNNLASSYADVGRYKESARLFEETLAIQKVAYGPNARITLITMGNLADSYLRLGRYQEAIKCNEETVSLQKATLGPDHPDTIICMGNLANCFLRTKRFDEALKLYQETHNLRVATLGRDHPDTLMGMGNLAWGYFEKKQYADAIRIFEETLTRSKKILGPYHPDTLKAMADLASGFTQVGRFEEAIKLLEDSLKLMDEHLGPNHPFSFNGTNVLAICYDATGRYVDALKLRESTLTTLEATLGPDLPPTLACMNGFAWSLLTIPDVGMRDPDKALQLSRHIVDLAPHEPDYWTSLGAAHYRAGDWNSALAALKKSVELNNVDIGGTWLFLAMTHWQLNDQANATQCYQRAIEWINLQSPHDKHFNTIRDEAEALLGLPESND